MTTATVLSASDLELTTAAQGKMAELFSQVEENIEGVRVFATPGGCSGINFGMTFTDQLNANDGTLEFEPEYATSRRHAHGNWYARHADRLDAIHGFYYL